MAGVLFTRLRAGPPRQTCGSEASRSSRASRRCSNRKCRSCRSRAPARRLRRPPSSRDDAHHLLDLLHGGHRARPGGPRGCPRCRRARAGPSRWPSCSSDRRGASGLRPSAPRSADTRLTNSIMLRGFGPSWPPPMDDPVEDAAGPCTDPRRIDPLDGFELPLIDRA